MIDKESALLALAKQRQLTRWPGYSGIGDYYAGRYECDFVSPFTKAAGNVNAKVMVVLQDWSSDEELQQGLDEETRRLGYDPGQPTICNLKRLLRATFGLSLSAIYGTNLFPFVKSGGVSTRIPSADLITAAREFAIPQINIVQPRLVIALGLETFEALRCALGLKRVAKMDLAIDSPFNGPTCRIWCQAHTGAFGQMNRNRGGVDRVSQDWLRMKADACLGTRDF